MTPPSVWCCPISPVTTIRSGCMGTARDVISELAGRTVDREQERRLGGGTLDEDPQAKGAGQDP